MLITYFRTNTNVVSEGQCFLHHIRQSWAVLCQVRDSPWLDLSLSFLITGFSAKSSCTDCELLLQMFPPAITASTKWSKQVSKLAGKWKQFLQNWEVVKQTSWPATSVAHIHLAAYLHTVLITVASQRLEMKSVESMLQSHFPQFSSLPDTIKKNPG